MSTTCLGYRYISTSIGVAKLLYLETTTVQNNLTLQELQNAIGDILYDGSIFVGAQTGNYISIAGAKVCGVTTTFNSSLNRLNIGNNCITSGGSTAPPDYYCLTSAILKLNTGEYQLIGVNAYIASFGSFVPPSSTQIGYLVWSGYRKVGLSDFGSQFFDSNVSNYLKANPPSKSIPDPYSPVGNSTTGGGDGTFDGTSDPVPVPNLPSVGAQDSGFITLFAPTAQQMKDLAHYMWVNPLFDLTAFKKIFADPMDCILGLSVVPVSVPSGGAKNVNIGNLVTSVTMNVASQQYIEVDCGMVNMAKRFFGSYLDFEPYTKISIFLPYCGTHQLNADDIIGKTIGVVYHIDILTGSCIAFIKCGDSVLYEFNGACGSNIPVNSLNFASTIENAIRIAVNIGTTVATAGASAPVTAATEGAQTIRTAANVGRAISLAGSTAEGALSMKPNVSRSGALGGGVGILGHQIPYLIITRPRLCKPANQDFFEGYPSFIQTTIGDLIGKGFTSFTDVIIASQYLTDSEESELEQILQGGVYL